MNETHNELAAAVKRISTSITLLGWTPHTPGSYEGGAYAMVGIWDSRFTLAVSSSVVKEGPEAIARSIGLTLGEYLLHEAMVMMAKHRGDSRVIGTSR